MSDTISVYGFSLQLKSWLQQLDIGIDKTQKLLRLLHEVLLECKQRYLDCI